MTIVMDLSDTQLRVLGCLIEKEITTPDQYPLSLNGLTSACNQKSNRDPVLSLVEGDVQRVLDELVKLNLVTHESGFGSRVTKYKHRFCNTEFGTLTLSSQELGVLCVLFLRGPQTPGELRTRTNRLCEFSDVGEVEAVLRGLINVEDGPYVNQLVREPGKRESRYIHLFGKKLSDQNVRINSLNDGAQQEISQDNLQSDHSTESSINAGAQRISELESRVSDLEHELTHLKQKIAEFFE